jgi:hypothetical protein
VKAVKAKRGRPPVPKKLAKGSLLSVRFSQQERQALERAANRSGVTLSTWARSALISAADSLKEP